MKKRTLLIVIFAVALPALFTGACTRGGSTSNEPANSRGAGSQQGGGMSQMMTNNPDMMRQMMQGMMSNPEMMTQMMDQMMSDPKMMEMM